MKLFNVRYVKKGGGKLKHEKTIRTSQVRAMSKKHAEWLISNYKGKQFKVLDSEEVIEKTVKKA